MLQASGKPRVMAPPVRVEQNQRFLLQQNRFEDKQLRNETLGISRNTSLVGSQYRNALHNMINMSSRKDARSSYHPLLVSHPLECKNIPMQCFEHSRHGQRFDTGQRTTKGLCGSLWSVSEADGQASPTKVVAGPSDFFEFVLDIVECPAQTLSIRRKVSAGS